VKGDGGVRGLRHLPWVVIYGVAMGYLEAAVVVYLRAIYYPGGFRFPLVAFEPAHAWIEIAREGATLVMLAAVAILAGVDRWRRWLAFLLLFGIWDLAYYGGLWITLDWPASLGEWDLLFLIPVPWFSPVWAPMSVALSMIALSLLLAPSAARPDRTHVAGILLGGFVIFVSLTLPSWLRLLRGASLWEAPDAGSFPAWLLGIGLALVWGMVLHHRATTR